jgi:predicted nuclease of predicted toxin-antitoxin system
MRLLVDQDVYHATLVWIRSAGHESVVVKELGAAKGDG